MKVSEYVGYDAVGLAGLLRAGEVTAAELEAVAREATEQVDEDVNGLVGPLLPDALSHAADGVFAGVPFLLKDAGAVAAGVPHEIGSRMLAGYVPHEDSEMVRRFKRAGLAIIGRTATPEFTLHWNTTSVANGPTRNPWNLERVVGGSSGGAAALVAAGAVPMAHGNDAGGSIRMPAGCCGAVGLKPTRGRLPAEQSVVGDELNVDFAVTRTVRDSAALLDALHGPSRWSRYEIAEPARPYLDELDRDVEALRVGYLDTSGTPGIDASCTEAVAAVVRLLEGDGHDVAADEPAAPDDEVAQYPLTAISTYLAAWIDRMAALHGVTPSADNLESVIWATYQLGSRFTASDFRRSWENRLVAISTVREFFERYDLLVSPTVAGPAPALDGAVTLNDDLDDPLEWNARMASYMPFTSIFNVTGHPAISVPVGMSVDGLPVGVQLVAPFGREDRLLRLARRLETEFAWEDRVPHIWAGASRQAA
ncbi:MAG: amidase [Solirubrobacteraceae bacterium]|jgi:amidase|nr:amidase [Solirubrobacteraceae bacterium]